MEGKWFFICIGCIVVFIGIGGLIEKIIRDNTKIEIKWHNKEAMIIEYESKFYKLIPVEVKYEENNKKN